MKQYAISRAILYSITLAVLECNTLPFFEAPGHKRERVPVTTSYAKKPITMLLYGSACNDLEPFIDRNLNQLMQIGSNANINLLVHLDVYGPRKKKLTQRFIVTKNGMLQVGEDMSMDSGDPSTLIDAAAWAFGGNFPSDTKILIFWNHGTGDREPVSGRAINPSELFVFNPLTKRIELNRSIDFFDYLASPKAEKKVVRGICFDEDTGHFLTNREVGESLATICNTYLKGEPLDVVCCDACLMQGTGLAYSLKPRGGKPVAKYLIGSQEVVLATGYPYHKIFASTLKQPFTPEGFAQQVVQIFGATYEQITSDYTHSAIHLEAIDPLYDNINAVAELLIEGLLQQKQQSVRKFIQKSSSKNLCTYFEEPTYKDLHHLWQNMVQNIDMITLTTPERTGRFKQELKRLLVHGCSLIKKIVIANVAGPNLKNASGISIYLPEKRVDASYGETDFAKNNSWFKLITLYVQNKESHKRV